MLYTNSGYEGEEQRLGSLGSGGKQPWLGQRNNVGLRWWHGGGKVLDCFFSLEQNIPLFSRKQRLGWKKFLAHKTMPS